MIQNLRGNRDLGQSAFPGIYGLRASVVKTPSKPNDKQLAPRCASTEDLMPRSLDSENRLIRILTASYIFHDETKRLYQPVRG